MLIRRGKQLEFLQKACAAVPSADMALRDRPRVTTPIRLVCAEPDGMLVRIQPDATAAYAATGRWVFVTFEWESERFRLAARTLGVVGPRSSSGISRGLHLALPLRIERRPARQRLRLKLSGGPPVEATFTRMTDPRERFQAHLRDISSAGLGVVALTEECGAVRRNEPYWVEFTLPTRDRVALGARLVHQSASSGGETAQGWTFQAGDEPEFVDRVLARLAESAAPRNRQEVFP